MTVVVEACVDSVTASVAALRGGADRLELCENLDVGGTTPSAELIVAVRDSADLPIMAMIRPRGGSFVHSTEELEQMRCDIAMVVANGAQGLVVGVLTEAGEIDMPAMRALMSAAGETPVVFHRAFDRVADQISALDQLIELGVVRVLTSGGAPTALHGAAALQLLVRRADGRITIMAGGKVRGANVREVVDQTGVTEIHARCDLADGGRDEIRAIVAALK